MQESSPGQTISYPPQAQAIIDYIQNHLSKEITLEMASNDLNTSVSSLSRDIKHFFGIRYGELVTKMRMERAKHLLRNTTLRMNEIAEVVGYKSYITFYKVFTRFENTTPTDYRNGVSNS